MEQDYWIRSRGRVQGPFTAAKLHALKRRGRFNRHFEVSDDRSAWYPATDFPELFPSIEEPASSSRAHGSDGEPSIFDEELPAAAPARTRRSATGEADVFDQHAPGPGDADHDVDDDDEYPDEDEDSAPWLASVSATINDHPVAAVAFAAACAVGIAWYFFAGEGWGPDQAAYEALLNVRNEIEARHANQPSVRDWAHFGREVTQRLAPDIDRLEESASSRDHLKQELLFAARDDIPALLNELPRDRDSARKRLQERLNRIRDMLVAKRRVYESKEGSSFQFPQSTRSAPTMPKSARTMEPQPQPDVDKQAPDVIGSEPSSDSQTPVIKQPDQPKRRKGIL